MSKELPAKIECPCRSCEQDRARRREILSPSEPYPYSNLVATPFPRLKKALEFTPEILFTLTVFAVALWILL